ncbi:hypothetical protein [Lysinibacillus fusiformis]|nr:hypothetical protein [Lysinibacillus fusiformis]
MLEKLYIQSDKRFTIQVFMQIKEQAQQAQTSLHQPFVPSV